MIDGDEPVHEAVDFGIRLDAMLPTVQFGGDDNFCEAHYDGCRLRSGCGIFVGFDTVGYAALGSLDVVFTDAKTFEGTVTLEIPQRRCKETVRIRGSKVY